MATTTRPASDLVPAQRLRDAFARTLARPDDILWSRVALVAVTALAGVLYLWDLTISGYANEYYAMAAQAASQSWSAWFFGSLDASNFITLDKPPAATMLMGLSVRLLGLSSLSILLPQALLGIGTVALLFVIVRRSFGTAAATVAGVVMALTPVAVLMFRYDNPDALLTFVFVAGAGTMLAAIETGRRRWLVATGLLLGLAFLTKYLEAFVVVPGFVLAYLVAGRGSVRRRIVDLFALAAISLAASGWWVAIVQLIPASSRPYVGGSTGNSVLDLVFGYDGLGRIFGMFGFGGGPGGAGGGAPAGAGGGGSPFGGTPGLLRMFNSEFAGEISWLLPLSVAGLAAGLWAHRRADRRDRRLAAYLLWGGWLVVTVAVFSLMSGIIHPYYTVALVPAVAALVGAGGVELWRLGRRSALGRLLVAAAIVGSAAWAAVLLSSTPSFIPGLGFAILAVATAAALILLLPTVSIGASLPKAAAVVALVALLAGPAAYAGATIASAHSGGDPSSGPAGQGGPGGAGFANGGAGFANGAPGALLPNGGTFPGGLPGGFAGGFPGGQAGSGGPGGGTLSESVIDYLVANRGSARWLVAVASSNEAAPIQLATGIPVMATGGFSGSDAALSLAQLKAYVASGQLRFIVAGERGFGGGGSSDVSSWVTSSCTAVTVGGSQTSVYDCAGATGG